MHFDAFISHCEKKEKINKKEKKKKIKGKKQRIKGVLNSFSYLHCG